MNINLNIIKIIKTTAILTLIIFSSNAFSYNISMDRLFASDSYRYLYEDFDKNKFIENHHLDYNELRLNQKENIALRRIEDICEDIYYGKNGFIYNPIEAKKCFYVHILQMSPRSAMRLINISIYERDFEQASFYYGVFRSISKIDNMGAKHFILNNLNEDVFYDYYDKGLSFLTNNQILDNKDKFNKSEILAFSFIENHNDEPIEYLINDDFDSFIKEMRERVTSGNQILLLAQASNTNRISEFCFQQKSLPLAFNCLSYIIQNNFNHYNSINRMAYLISNQIDGDLIDTNEIVKFFGFTYSDPLARRLYLNFLNNDINKKEKYMYYYNRGRMLRSNYIETGDKI